MNSRTRDFLLDAIPFFGIAAFLLILLGIIATGSILSERGQNELAKTCIESGQQWIDDSCVTK